MEKRYQLIHNAAQNRYEFHLDGGVAYIEYEASREPGVWLLTHTIVPPQFEGQGIAGELAESTLEAFRERGERIIPECLYLVRYLQRHPEWRSLLPEGHRIEE